MLGKHYQLSLYPQPCLLFCLLKWAYSWALYIYRATFRILWMHTWCLQLVTSMDVFHDHQNKPSKPYKQVSTRASNRWRWLRRTAMSLSVSERQCHYQSLKLTTGPHSYVFSMSLGRLLGASGCLFETFVYSFHCSRLLCNSTFRLLCNPTFVPEDLAVCSWL